MKTIVSALTAVRVPRRVERACDDEQPILRPPDSITVIDEREVVLYTPDGRALVRRAGF